MWNISILTDYLPCTKKQFISRHSKHWTYNHNCYQDYSTDVCGQYCVYFYTNAIEDTDEIVCFHSQGRQGYPRFNEIIMQLNGLERLIANLKEIKDKIANGSGKTCINCCYCCCCSFYIKSVLKKAVLFIFF